MIVPASSSPFRPAEADAAAEQRPKIRRLHHITSRAEQENIENLTAKIKDPTTKNEDLTTMNEDLTTKNEDPTTKNEDLISSLFPEEPIPMTQEEIAHMPTIIQEENVEVPVPMAQEEIAHMPNIFYYEYMEIIMQEQEQIRQQQEMIVEVPIPMTQEEIADVHWTLAPAEIEDELFHSVVEVPVPMIQDELFNSHLGASAPQGS